MRRGGAPRRPSLPLSGEGAGAASATVPAYAHGGAGWGGSFGGTTVTIGDIIVQGGDQKTAAVIVRELRLR
jgi:hypothetical protein